MIQRVTDFRDADGRPLSSGERVRIEGAPRSWKFKIRHLRVHPTGGRSIELYGPVDDRGTRLPHAQYRSIPLDGIRAKVRG